VRNSTAISPLSTSPPPGPRAQVQKEEGEGAVQLKWWGRRGGPRQRPRVQRQRGRLGEIGQGLKG
jgi:hypothetical protein